MATTISLSLTHVEAQEPLNNLSLIWIDPNVDTSENRDVQTKLERLYGTFKKFTVTGDGVNTIRKFSPSSRLVLVVSGSIGREIVPQIHQLEQVLTIFIFCMKVERYKTWAEQFHKIKSIVADLDRLTSVLESSHSQWMEERTKEKVILPDTDSVTEQNDNSKLEMNTSFAFRYFPNLVQAGELEYLGTSIEDIVTDIANKHLNTSYTEVRPLILDIITPVLFLLKRRQNLSGFFDAIKMKLYEMENQPKLSQRQLIDTILINSDCFLRRYIIYLSSKWNPIPLIQPQTNPIKSPYRAIASLIHVWDYERPILLSFGIGLCKGKSQLLNFLFESNFEETVDDPYFQGTADLDFGFGRIERRDVNIADVHGEISIEDLKHISMLFQGFLVQIAFNDFTANQGRVIKYVESLPQQVSIQLVIRDVRSENDAKLKIAINGVRSACPKCEVFHIPNVADKTSLQNRTKMNSLREKIRQGASQLRSLDEAITRGYLEKLIDESEIEQFQEDRNFIKNIQRPLIIGRPDDYPLYSAFTKTSRTRLEIARTDPYGRDFKSEKLFQLNDELFNAEAEFKQMEEMGSNHFGRAFESFLKVLEKQSRLYDLRLLSMELQRQRDKHKLNHQKLPFYEQLSIDLHWRNVIIGSSSLSQPRQQMVLGAYRDYVVEGNPFEIVDGDNFEMQGCFLLEVFKLFPRKKFFVISVLGPQNSGKSTLLNLLFGTSFEARDGRCTKGTYDHTVLVFESIQKQNKKSDLSCMIFIVGVYGALINVRNRVSKDKLIPLDYDYILVIDTEGIMSLQKDDNQYDQSLILFCLAVSHLVIVNVEGEISEPVKKYFLLCIQALKYLGETRVTRPTVHFVLNKRKDPNVDYCRSLLEYVRQAIQDTKLDQEINLKEENVHILPIVLNSNLSTTGSGDSEGSSTAGALLVKVQSVCHSLLQASSQIINETGDNFCVPANWINFAYRVLQTIKKHPSLTYFQDVFERKQYQDIREDIRKDFDTHLSPTLARYLIDQGEGHDNAQIKDSFKKQYDDILKTLEENHKAYCDKHEATENIRELSLRFLKTQMNGIIHSWEFSALMRSKQHENEVKMNELEGKLREKAIHITHKNYIMDREAAKIMFNEVFEQFMKTIMSNDFQVELQWKQSIELVHHLCDIFDIDALPSIDNLFKNLNFLVSLDCNKEQRISIRDYLSHIRTACVSRSSNINLLNAHGSISTGFVSTADIQRSYKFLDNEEMKYHFVQSSMSKPQTREKVRKTNRQQFLETFQTNWKSIIKLSACFDALTMEIQKLVDSPERNEFQNEIKFMQDILGAVKEVIKNLKNELDVFGFSLSKEFSSSLYEYAFLAATLHYYNQQKNHFLDGIENLKNEKSKLVDKYIPWVVIVDNDDESLASNLINDFCQVVLHHLFKPQIEEMITKNIDESKHTLYRSSIVKKLDDQVYHANDEWLMKYVIDPQQLISQHFESQWLILRRKLETSLNNTKTKISMILLEFFHLIEQMNVELQQHQGHALSFVDELFLLKEDQTKSRISDKKFCMGKLFYGYFLAQSIPELSTQHGSTYTVNSRWESIIANLPKPSEELQKIFNLMKSTFETATITYLGLFLEKILKKNGQTERTSNVQMDSLIDKHFRTSHDRFFKQMEECGKRCPACKRICDVDHHLDKASPVGQGNNRHCCQSGHQIRAMGGIRYESTNEASLLWCGIIRDNNKVITSEAGVRQTWKAFKEAHPDWDFGDEKSSEDFQTRYFPIWKKIGKKLCAHFVQNKIVLEMKYVEKNSPTPINHFILLLDHSGSMNEKPSSAQQLACSLTQTTRVNLTPWENLVNGVQQFLGIRNHQQFQNDKITVIIFANRVEKVYHREKLARVHIDRLKIPMRQCGEGTQYGPAFEMVTKTLEDINNEPERNRYRQTIIFMTDGEPQDDASTELRKLSDWREGVATNPNDKALIHNFWIVALGHFNQTVINEINKRMHGKLVHIDQPEDLVDAYANFAEILT